MYPLYQFGQQVSAFQVSPFCRPHQRGHQPGARDPGQANDLSRQPQWFGAQGNEGFRQSHAARRGARAAIGFHRTAVRPRQAGRRDIVIATGGRVGIHGPCESRMMRLPQFALEGGSRRTVFVGVPGGNHRVNPLVDSRLNDGIRATSEVQHLPQGRPGCEGYVAAMVP